jgi:tight adherence protein B
VRALSSEGRISAVMLTLLPVATFLFLFLVNPPFYLDVAGDPMFVPGFLALIGLYLVGFWMMRKMVDLKV